MGGVATGSMHALDAVKAIRATMASGEMPVLCATGRNTGINKAAAAVLLTSSDRKTVNRPTITSTSQGSGNDRFAIS